MELSPDLSNMIMQFTDQLIIKDNLVNKILGNIFFAEEVTVPGVYILTHHSKFF
jgi:hypothetical protein